MSVRAFSVSMRTEAEGLRMRNQPEASVTYRSSRSLSRSKLTLVAAWSAAFSPER